MEPTFHARVLIVDDEESVCRLCERLIGAAGHYVKSAGSAEEAFLRMREGWDVILSDIALNDHFNGIDVLRRARKNSTADVIIMTGAPEVDSAIAAIREGAYDYLPKPFSNDALMVAVNRCLEKRRLSNELRLEKALRAELDLANTELQKMERLNHMFGQFVTPEVARFVTETPEEVWRKGERRNVSVFFMDVRSFTPFAESVEPEEAVEALNEIFAGVVKAIQDEGGVTNKFLGDGLLALFGAPVPNDAHAVHAVRAALRARTIVEAVAARRTRAGKTGLRIGIGVNTGDVMAACLGGENRAEYSVIGHAVNLASRLENEALPGQILAGPDTVSRLPDNFRFGLKIPCLLPGIRKPVIATEILGEEA